MTRDVSRETASSASSSDDEEDKRNLIPQNETNHLSNSQSFSAFDIDATLGYSLRRQFSTFDLKTLAKRKRYLFWALLPLLVVLLYFYADLGSLFRKSKVWDLKFVGSSYSDETRESELQALSLLRDQQLGLISLLKTVGSNHNTVNTSIEGKSKSSEEALGKYKIQDIRAKIYDQILVNNEIRKVLLANHKPVNSSVSAMGDAFGNFTFVGSDEICGRINAHLSNRRTIEWIPRSSKFLFAICVSGQMSNHLICLEKHMFFAAILKRVLVIPSPKVDYQYSRVLDIEHINECLGRKVVVTFDEFHEMKKNDMRINKFICYFPDCYIDAEHVKKLKNLGLSLPKLESPWTDDVKNPKERTIEEFESKFSSDDEVVAIGDVFFANLEQEWMTQPGGPIAHQCKALIEPSRLIVLTAQRFIQTFLGRNYVSLHFRRHGFLKFCNVKSPSCFFPVPQAADCIRRVVERANNAPVVYLSTDAAESETGLLQSLMVIDGKPVPLVKRPSRNSAEKWDALLYRHGLSDDSQVDAMLDKTISAMASVFIGSSGSTFTEDILRLRKDWGTASWCDQYICQGVLPNFLAEVE